MPFLDVRYRNLLFLSPLTGLGVNAIATDRAQLGVAVLPDFGRSASSADVLRGWGDVGPGASAKLFAVYSLGLVALLADVRHQLGAGNGTLVDGGVTTTLPLARRLIRYARAYFGVDANQSRAALAYGQALRTFSAGAGLRDAALALAAIVPIDPRWSVHALFRGEFLLGDAASSPLTGSRVQPTFGGFLAYRL